jgi:hypothetical protein
LNQLSDRIFGEFIKLFGIEKKFRTIRRDEIGERSKPRLN